MLIDPRQILADLGLNTITLKEVEILSERHGHAIWRIVMPERSYVLKWMPDESARVEIEGYRLLQRLGVPTLPVVGSTEQALLLEDLAHSDQWRLAEQADAARAEVGQAVARWYRVFHAAGEALLSQEVQPDFLRRETDALTSEGLLAAGQTLGLANSPVWDLASRHLERLKTALASLSFTLNYNDFHWTNLALSRTGNQPLEAIIFDYHLLGVGMRCSDCRNVAFSLTGEAVEAFWDAYGEVDPREAILDCPLADLCGLQLASQMPKFPQWAQESRQRLLNGDLEKDLRAAIGLNEEMKARRLNC